MPQDFRTGYYTLTSPRSLVAAQLVGAFIGVLFAPGVYAFYTHSFDVGVDYEYSVPYAKVRAVLSGGAYRIHDTPAGHAGCMWSHRLACGYV